MVEAASEKGSHEEQRYFPRWETSNRVLYQSGKNCEIHQASTKDLSCAGVCIRTDRPLHQNKIKLTIFLNSNTSVVVDGRILWNRPDEGQTLVGVLFENIPLQSQELILQYAFETDQQKVLNRWFEGWDKK